MIGAAAALVAAAPAAASTAGLANGCLKTLCSEYLVFRGEPGERNVLTTAVAPDGRALIVRDAGAALRGCPPVEGGVQCSTSYGTPPVTVYAYLGDGDDQATTLGRLFGGAGNDRLEGDGELSGGPGDDVLTGGGVFHDADGDSRGRDVYTGAKELRYDPRTLPVRVDLRPGQPSEDRITNVKSITGGRGDDVLIGDDGPNELSGGGGGDRVRGLGGDDVLSGNHVDGGPGDDTLLGGYLGARVRCGPGTDTVRPSERGLIGADCEYVEIEDDATWRVRLHATVRRAGAPVIARVVCRSVECPNRWRLKAGRRIVGEVKAGKRPSALRLNAEGWAMLERRRTLRVQVERRRKITGYDSFEYDRFPVELRRP